MVVDTLEELMPAAMDKARECAAVVPWCCGT